jgi:hypothetical protein
MKKQNNKQKTESASALEAIRHTISKTPEGSTLSTNGLIYVAMSEDCSEFKPSYKLDGNRKLKFDASQPFEDATVYLHIPIHHDVNIDI